MHTASARTNRKTIERWLGAAMAALMITLPLGGLAARPASAQTWDDGTAQANNFIAWCFRAGGEPELHEGSGFIITASCFFPGGVGYVCHFYPNVDCQYYPPTRTQKPIGDQLGGEGGVATSDPSAGAGIADGQNGGMSAKTAVAGGNDQPKAHPLGHRHGAAPKPAKAANHQKAHAGKK
jgi:hypothetical protein